MEKPDKKSLKARINILQKAIDLFNDKELELIIEKNPAEFDLSPLPLDASVFRDAYCEKIIVLKKFILKGNGKFDTVA